MTIMYNYRASHFQTKIIKTSMTFYDFTNDNVFNDIKTRELNLYTNYQNSTT
eukprot:m.53618 g.53618  ORF g.53618 m.53618 type:complete len:52 (+) comp10874_c0_seq2:3475-3630(+)